MHRQVLSSKTRVMATARAARRDGLTETVRAIPDLLKIELPLAAGLCVFTGKSLPWATSHWPWKGFSVSSSGSSSPAPR
jgi:hypothetical protein